jgi:hypothetical protein
MASILRAPGILMQALLLGPLLAFILTKAYFAVVTSHGRLVLIRTSMGMFSWKRVNLGVEEIPLAQCQQVTTSGLLNNRSITFHFPNGHKQTFRIAPWSKMISGQKAFLDQVPNLINQRQLPAVG